MARPCRGFSELTGTSVDCEDDAILDNDVVSLRASFVQRSRSFKSIGQTGTGWEYGCLNVYLFKNGRLLAWVENMVA